MCKSLVAGGVTGGVFRTTVVPLERMKILLQVQNSHSIKYSGTVQGLKYIWRTEGLRELFKGNGTNCVRIVPNSAVKFFSYEKASQGILWLYRRQPRNGACLCRNHCHGCNIPDGHGTRLFDHTGNTIEGIFHALTTVFKEEGPRALYRGWLPSVIGVIPYVGLSFAVYESLKDWLVTAKPFGLVQNNETTKLACGAAAGTIGQTVAYPLDVVRQKMKMVGWKDASSVIVGDEKTKAPIEYTSMVDAFKKIVGHEGFRSLYKGLVLNSVKVVPSIAIAFVMYEVIKDILGVEIRMSD